MDRGWSQSWQKKRHLSRQLPISPNKIAGIFLLASFAIKVLRRCWVAGIALSRLSIGLEKADERIQESERIQECESVAELR